MSTCAWLALALTLGCGHPAAPAAPGRGSAVAAPDAAVDAPVPLEDDLPRLADRAVKLYADWQAALTAAGTDCALATTKMNAIADANADVIEANHQLYRGSRERVIAFRAELEKRQTDLDASAKAILAAPAMQKCSNDPAFSKALDRLGGEG